METIQNTISSLCISMGKVLLVFNNHRILGGFLDFTFKLKNDTW